MRQSGLVAYGILVALLAGAHGAKLLVVDSKEASYVRASDRPASSLDQRGVSSLLSAFTGLLPPSAISLELSRVINSILKPSPFLKPRACVVLNVAGLSAEELVPVFGSRNRQVVDIVDLHGTPAAVAVVDAVNAVAAANPDTSIVPLEHLALQDCGVHCVQQHVDALVESVSAELVALDIGRNGAQRLFAVELANALAGVRAYVKDALEAPAVGSEVVEMTVLGLHPLVASYGADAPQVEVAKAAVLDVLHQVVAVLDQAFNGDVAYQVSLLDSVPVHAGSMQELMSWKEASRKQLMQMRGLQTSTFPGPDEVAQAKSFSVKAAAYGSFLLLLYFTMAGIYCMCNMPFKQDTMLFGRTKAD